MKAARLMSTKGSLIESFMSKFISTLKPGEVFLYPPVTHTYIIEGIVTKQDMTTDGKPFSHWRFLDRLNSKSEIATGYSKVAKFGEFKDVVNDAFYEEP